MITNSIRLTEDQLETYQRDGYLIVEDLVSSEEAEALRNRVREYTHGDRPTDHLQVEIEPKIRRGELEVDHPGDGIRKLGGLVTHDDLFRKLGLEGNIVDIMEQILGQDLKLFRNALMVKPPEVGSQKGMHQDSPYWPIEPMALCTCWYAIDEATVENGCMGIIPGWHKKGHLPHKHVTDDFVVDEEHYDMKDMVMAPLRPGSGLFFHSLMPHYTAPNRSKNWRRAIALAYMSAKSRYTKEGDKPEFFQVRGKSYPGCV